MQANSKVSAIKQQTTDILRAYKVSRLDNSYQITRKLRKRDEEHTESSDSKNKEEEEETEIESIKDGRNQDSPEIQEFERNDADVVDGTVNNTEKRTIY